MNTFKIIFVLLFTCLLLQNSTFSLGHSLVKNDSTYFKKLFRQGEKAYIDKKYAAAKDKLIEFISVPCPVKDTLIWRDPGYRYILLKNQACGYLKQIYYSEKNFEAALIYNSLQSSIYNEVIIGCFWAVTEKRYALDNFGSKCHEELNEFTKAIDCIMQYWGFYDTRERFVQIAKKKVGLDSLRNELLTSVDSIFFAGSFFKIKLLDYNLTVSYFPPNYVRPENKRPEIRVNGNDTEYIAVPNVMIPRTEEEIEQEKIKVKETFKQSDFYKLIMEN